MLRSFPYACRIEFPRGRAPVDDFSAAPEIAIIRRKVNADPKKPECEERLMAPDETTGSGQVSQTRRLFIVACSGICIVAAPVATICFFIDVYESHYQRLPISFVFVVLNLFAIFGLAVLGLNKFLGTTGRSRK